jgi:hypothetical protein
MGSRHTSERCVQKLIMKFSVMYGRVFNIGVMLFQPLLVLPLNIIKLFLLMWRIWLASNNASRWQMGFNSAFKVLMTN